MQGELESFLVEITERIFAVKDDKGEGYLIDKVLDKTGMKVGGWVSGVSGFFKRRLPLPPPASPGGHEAGWLGGRE
jgi:6-phosphogluconate dehydrogenase